MGVRGVEGQRKVHYQIPRALPTAFQRLVMLLVAGSATILSVSLPQYQSRFQIFERCCLECEQSMLDGRNQLILMVHTDDYREHAGYEAVDSAALLSIMMRNLLDVSHKKSNFHLTDIYSEYTAKIVCPKFHAIDTRFGILLAKLNFILLVNKIVGYL